MICQLRVLRTNQQRYNDDVFAIAEETSHSNSARIFAVVCLCAYMSIANMVNPIGNFHFNYSNVCIRTCTVCSFAYACVCTLNN